MAGGVVLWVFQTMQSLHEFMHCGSVWLDEWSIQSLFLRSHLQKNTTYHTLHYQPKEEKSCHLQQEMWFDPCDTSAKHYSVYTTEGCSSFKKLNLITRTSWKQILEQLIVPWVIKQFSACYAIWRLIIIFTLAHHMCVSLARWIQSICSHPSF